MYIYRQVTNEVALFYNPNYVPNEEVSNARQLVLLDEEEDERAPFFFLSLIHTVPNMDYSFRVWTRAHFEPRGWVV